MMEALEGASSLQLYQLKAIIEGMLTDPRRPCARGARPISVLRQTYATRHQQAPLTFRPRHLASAG